jgi:hypothetical protein
MGKSNHDYELLILGDSKAAEAVVAISAYK